MLVKGSNASHGVHFPYFDQEVCTTSGKQRAVRGEVACPDSIAVTSKGTLQGSERELITETALEDLLSDYLTYRGPSGRRPESHSFVRRRRSDHVPAWTKHTFVHVVRVSGEGRRWMLLSSRHVPHPNNFVASS